MMARVYAQQRYIDIENRIPEFFEHLTDLEQEEFRYGTVIDIETDIQSSIIPVNAVSKVQIIVRYKTPTRWMGEIYNCYLDDSGKRMFANPNTDREFETRIDQWLRLF